MIKDNQQELRKQVEKVFAMNPKTEADITIDAGHGRVEQRSCQAIDSLAFLDDTEEWPGLKSIAKVISERQTNAAERHLRKPDIIFLLLRPSQKYSGMPSEAIGLSKITFTGRLIWFQRGQFAQKERELGFELQYHRKNGLKYHRTGNRIQKQQTTKKNRGSLR